jgi:hypothetical protein
MPLALRQGAGPTAHPIAVKLRAKPALAPFTELLDDWGKIPSGVSQVVFRPLRSRLALDDANLLEPPESLAKYRP